MVVKFFSNKKGGSAKAVNYLLNHREQEGTARVLQGDPDLTRQIINDIKFKQKTTVGCLSFEEQNISEEMKHQLIEDFERMLIPGLDKSRYNILWVEHTDKGRLELNFVIPKIELETQKSLNPYFHKADLPRVEKWQDLQNLKYEFSNPKDPSKARTVEINSHIKKFNNDYEQLDKLLHNLAEQGELQNREQLIELLKNSGIEVTRTGKDYLSIKLPDSKKARKFKGGIYHEQFTSIREIETISEKAEQRVREYNYRDTRAEQQKLIRELESYTRQKEQRYRELYPATRERTQNKNREIEREFNRDTQEQTPKYRGNDKRETGAREQSQSNINWSSNIHNNSSIDNRGSNVNIEQAVQQGRLNNLSYNKEVENDSTRTSINARTPTRESTKYRDYRETRKARTELYKSITETAESLREQSISNSRELHPTHRNTTRDIQQRIRIIENEHKQVIQQSESHLQQAGDIEHKSNGLTKLRQFGRKLKDTIVSTREMIKEKISLISGFYKKEFNYKSEPLEKEIKEIEVKKMLGREIRLKEVKNLEGVYAKESLIDTMKFEKEKERTKQRENSRSHYNSR